MYNSTIKGEVQKRLDPSELFQVWMVKDVIRKGSVCPPLCYQERAAIASRIRRISRPFSAVASALKTSD